MTIMENTVRGLGKLTGSTFKVVKNAPKKTASKTKDLKEAFVDGLKSEKSDTPNNDGI